MIDVNWDLAPEGATGIAQRNTKLAFTDKDGNIFLDGHWGISSFWHVVSTRPTFAESITKTPSQTKTVADAVEYCNHEWVSAENEYVKGASICTKCKTIAETATIEQEGEKWTHTTNSGYKCKILVKEPDSNGVIIVLTSDGEYKRHDSKTLKPIKPTLTKADCELLLKFKKHIVDSDKSRLDDMLDDFIDMHDII